ncbi:mandelate racemase/muconate lactonizing enzyme family protein [Corynebacterium sp. S7]
MPIIKSIEAIPYTIDYETPLRFASGMVDKADHVLVRVTTESGIVGIADAPPRPYTYGETQESIVAVINKILAPALIGKSAFATSQVAEILNRTVNNNVAKASIDIALWDIKGKITGSTVTDLLGGYTDRVKISHMVGFATPEEIIEEINHLTEKYGIDAYKVKVGRRPVQDDIDVCRAIRDEFGPEMTLYIDGNRGWNARESAFAIKEMEDLDLQFIEELNPASEGFGRRRIVKNSSIPFIVDESAPTPTAVWRSLQDGDGTAVSIKTARTGFTDSLRIWGLCTSAGVDMVLGNQIDTQIGSLATIAFGAAFLETSQLPAEVSNFLDMKDDLQAEPIKIEDGYALVSKNAGYGALIDEGKLDYYRLDK